MSTSSIYDQWADIYDSVYSYVVDDIRFYVEQSINAGGRVLELGCGTGRITTPIATSGVDIVGVDFSPDMLRVANRKLVTLPATRRRPQLVLADMRTFSFGSQFDLIIIPFRGFQSLLTVEDQVTTLNNIKEHLAPGGKLIFNVFVPDPDAIVQPGDLPYHFRDVVDPRSGQTYVIWMQSHYESFNQLSYARLIIETLDDNKIVMSRMYRDFWLRYAYRWEMHHLLTTCGFEIEDLYGDFEYGPFDELSSEMVWVVQPL